MRVASLTIAILAIILSMSSAQAQSGNAPQHKPNFVAEPQTIPLWPQGAPGALGTSDADVPTLTIYLPLDPVQTRTAVIVAPGGGYGMLASNHEGRQVANWLNAMGITAFVLKYRLGPRYHYPIELEDAQRAIRLVRSRAAEIGYSPSRVGMMGFSAGGHLTSMAGTHFDDGNPSASDPIDRLSCRPDFLVLAYPVISMSASFTHQGSELNLLGENASPELRKKVSSELQVTPQTPPTFLFAITEDETVPVENTVAFYQALIKAGVPAEMHIFEQGHHGVGLDLGDPVLGIWPTLLTNWLREHGWLTQ
jgi:acetyl esterase/lipase